MTSKYFTDLVSRLVPFLGIGIKSLAFWPDEKRKVLYHYEFVHKDSRVWHQILNFTVPSDPGMTFDVKDSWKLSEFALHRDVRNSVVLCHNQCGMTDLSIKAL